MRHISPCQLSSAIAFSLFTCIAQAGEPCLDNFSSSGNLLIGKTYKTQVPLTNISPQEAFEGALQFTANNGFAILSSDRSAGVISAAQANSRGNGKNVPLSIVMKADGSNTLLAMSYATPAGVHSPEDAIKKHFCATATAAANSSRTPAPSSVAAISQPTQRKGYAVISPEQKTSIETEWAKNIPNESIGERASQAKSNAGLFLERLSCLSDYAGIEPLMAGTSALNEFAAPNTNFSQVAITLRPMRDARYHDKKLCMTVARISDWKSPANNALTFEVLFKADDSGETKKLRIETIRQTDGAWLFGYFQ